ncbi:MAG: hypothetical protein FWF52_00280 [Candidatus Azobacteroides sp.]|nr:hypothetical protein [Candidatus Azobacteroides sp.]
MKIGKIKKDKRYESRNDKSLGIQTFGENNDYPQQVMEIVGASCTGSSCIDVFSKFIAGQGFNDSDFFNLTINKEGQTNDVLLNLITRDFAMFNGFAIHINYNANYKATQLNFVPFETIRLGSLDDNGTYNTVSIHWDWGRRMTQIRRWSKEDIIVIDLFDPNPQAIEEQVFKAGGWEAYKGQVYYYSGNRANNYPLPKYDSVLTDMSTEEGIANISYRNTRNNFLISGMLIDILEKNESEDQENENEKNLLEFQGDEEAVKIMYTSVESREAIPQFVKFSGQNYDKEYTVTREKVKNDIGRSFNQPPILRAEDVGSNFGADALRNSYDYYNSVTEVERLQVERVFTQIFQYWNGDLFDDFSIVPLSYGQKVALFDRFGKDGIEKMNEILNSSIETEMKKRRLKTIFDLTDAELENLGI